MPEVIGVQLKSGSKIYYFDPNHSSLKKGDYVIVQTARGLECGKVAIENFKVKHTQISHPIKKIHRVATQQDLKIMEENAQKAKAAMVTCNQKIAQHKLKMKLIEAEYTFDRSKILFYFTSDGRVDFRELVKDLASIFRTRIELRQIGVRDEAKMLGGLGVCGKPFCCSTFLNDFHPVSIKMAKEQNLSLNPTKISGTCGRLMCCLKYEQEAYTDLLKTTPKIGAVVNTPEGRGIVMDQNLLTGILKIRLDSAPEAAYAIFKVSEVSVIKDAKIKVAKEEMEKLKELE